MAVLFASNSMVDLTGSGTIYTGTAEARDTNYADEEIEVALNPALDTFLNLPAVDEAELWIHFRMKTPSTMDSGAVDGNWMEFLQDTGLKIGGLDLTNGDIRAEAVIVDGALWSPANNTVYTIDIHIQSSGAGVQVDLYVDGSLVSSAASASARTNVASIVFDHNDMVQTADSIFYSEFIIDNAESTIGCRLHSGVPNALGTYTEFTGVVSDIQTFNDGNAAIADADGERLSYDPPSYTGDVSSGTNVRAVIAAHDVVTGVTGSGPDQLTQFLRIGSTDYYGSLQTPGGGIPVRVREIWTEDPSTASPWDINDMGTFEVGIRAET